MSRPNLPSAVSQYLDGVNAEDAAQAAAAFAEDAVVHDESHDHVGRLAIQTWIQAAIDRYAGRLLVEGVTESADAIVAAVRMTGNFPGSPLTVRFLFQLADAQITHLDIRS